MDNVNVQYRTTKQNQGNRGRRLWIIHDEEVNEGPNSAEAVARGLAASDRRASIHACVDSNSVAGMVDWEDTAWHAAHSATNWCSIGIEHDGFAHQSRAEWLDNDGGILTLQRSAQLFKDVGMRRYGIQPRLVVGDYGAIRDIVLNGRGSGVCGHRDITYAFGISGGHTDPGTEFPYDQWLSWATGTDIQLPQPPTPPPANDGYMRKGSSGGNVALLQRQLNTAMGAGLTVDGSFGPATEAAVKSFQSFFRLQVDGVVGPQTQSVLNYAVSLKANPTPTPVGQGRLSRPQPTLRLGMSGQQVRNLQAALNVFNGNLTVDGTLGPRTRQALINFQRFLGMVADGIYGPQTAAAMNMALTNAGK